MIAACLLNYKWLGHRKVNLDMYNLFLSSKNTVMSTYYFQDYWKSIFDMPLPWLNIFKNLYKLSYSTHLFIYLYKIFDKLLLWFCLLNTFGMNDNVSVQSAKGAVRVACPPPKRGRDWAALRQYLHSNIGLYQYLIECIVQITTSTPFLFATLSANVHRRK